MFDRHEQRALSLTFSAIVAVLLILRVGTSVQQETALVRWVGPGAVPKVGKPVVYVFHAEWCAPCRRLEREAFSDRDVARLLNEQFVPVRVVDRTQEDGANPLPVRALIARFHVAEFPTIVVVDESGTVLQRLTGYHDKERIRATLVRFAASRQ